MAKEVPITLYHSNSDVNVPDPMGAGEMAVATGTTTRVWVSDGTTNRLLASNALFDNPILTPWRCFITDTMPTVARERDLWWDSASGAFFVRYTGVWVQINGMKGT